jgi:PhzF family phenazine biosynthesis protein
MTVQRAFVQVDVFGNEPYRGNPLAVVLDAAGLSAQQMQDFARWTNLSETTFLLPPEDPGADYTVRIFTTDEELPFAGHPTLGSCRAWLEHHPEAARRERLVQHCAAGLVQIRRNGDELAFMAPPLVRSGPVAEGDLARFADQLGIKTDEIVDANWVDNGPGWVAVLLADAASVLALRPSEIEQKIGAVGPYPDGAETAFEVRAFCPWKGSVVEDPVTGSLNASLAGWLIATGRAHPPYVVSQGTVLGRAGRVLISQQVDGIWVGGSATTCVRGTVDL